VRQANVTVINSLPVGIRSYIEKAGYVECDDKAYTGASQLFTHNGKDWIERSNRLFKMFIAQTLRGIVSLGGVEGMSTDEEAEEFIRLFHDELGSHKIHYLLVRAWGRRPETT
jgi:hypothetical protein